MFGGVARDAENERARRVTSAGPFAILWPGVAVGVEEPLEDADIDEWFAASQAPR